MRTFHTTILFTVICCLLFMFSCQNPFNVPEQEQLPVSGSGKGAVSVRVTGDSARTILPATLTEADILSYRLIFTNEELADTTVDRLGNTLNEPVVLYAGTYTLRVIAYTDNAWTKPVAEGSYDGIAIEDGGSITCTVTLSAYGVVTGKDGFFSWNIRLPEGGADTALMKIRPLDTVNGTAEQELNLLGGTSPHNRIGSVTLKSSYYQIMFTLQKAGLQDITWYETLHVYQNMTSPFTHTFNDGDFSTVKYIVTFNFNYEGAPPSLLQTRASGQKAIAPPAPGRAGYSFDGWYMGDTAWNFNDEVTADITLSAKWEEVLIYSIALKSGGNALSAFTFTAATVGYSAQTALEVTVENTGNRATGALAVMSSSENFVVSNNNAASGIMTGGSATFTITPAAGLAVNTYTATVTVSGGNDITASFTVSFTVNPVPRTIVVAMYDFAGDGWDRGGTLHIYLDGTLTHDNVRVFEVAADNIPSGQGRENTYTFEVYGGENVEFRWVGGTGLRENSFIVYYSDTPPIPEFNSSNNITGANAWNGQNALLFKLGTQITGDGTMGSFIVEIDVRPPRINTHPSNISYYHGGEALQPTLSVTAESPDGGTLSYQWYRNTANSATGGTPVGANSNTYQPDVSSFGIMYYYCVVTNTNYALFINLL